jgi:plastocyanin
MGILQSRYADTHRRGTALLLASALMTGSFEISAETKPNKHTVIIEALQYAPEPLEANIGDVVLWRNKDAFPHTVTADSHAFDSGEILSSGRWEWKAQTKGVFAYRCTFHPTMHGTLIVR